MGLGLAEVVWVRSTVLVRREPKTQLYFHNAAPTQPIMQERTFKSLFQKIGQTELKHFLVEMQLNVDLSDCCGSVPGSNFRDAAEKRPSTFFCFSLPSPEKEGKAAGLRGLHQGKKSQLLPWDSCIQQLVSAASAAPREAEGAAVGGMSRGLDPCLLHTWMCHIKNSFQTQVGIDCRGALGQNLLSILTSWLDLWKSEDRDSEKHRHKSVSLFCCFFFFL